MNDAGADMHSGTRRLVLDCAKHPMFCVGEMPYDALHAFIPMYHAGGGPRWQKIFALLSTSQQSCSGSGARRARSRFRPLSILRHFHQSQCHPNAAGCVDDTFAKYRDVMTETIRRAKVRAGISWARLENVARVASVKSAQDARATP